MSRLAVVTSVKVGYKKKCRTVQRPDHKSQLNYRGMFERRLYRWTLMAPLGLKAVCHVGQAG
jgi:hypothetical protein